MRSITIKITEDIARATLKLAYSLEKEGPKQRLHTQETSQVLCDLLCEALKIPPVNVSVRAKRPSSSTSELHGLYTRQEGKQSSIQVWRKTAALRKTVKFKTFLRTLIHELCHHIDYEYLRLDDSFHTEGFFVRESLITKKLIASANAYPTKVQVTGKNTQNKSEKPIQLQLIP